MCLMNSQPTSGLLEGAGITCARVDYSLSEVTLVSHHYPSSLPPTGVTNTLTSHWWTLSANLTCLLWEMHMHYYDYYSQCRTTVLVPVRWSLGLTDTRGWIIWTPECFELSHQL